MDPVREHVGDAISPSVDATKDEMNPEGKSDEPKATYKSYKKKYRKLQVKFNEAMTESDKLILDIQRAEASSKRLALSNDQLQDLLLDANNSGQMPPDKRIDLSIETPALITVPGLLTSDELALAREANDPECDAIYKEMLAMLEERTVTSTTSKPSKSLAHLIATTPHTSTPTAPPQSRSSIPNPDSSTDYTSYPSIEDIEERDALMDTTIEAHLAGHPVPEQPRPDTFQDLAFRNSHSPYNWLRVHEPKVFLQDGESSEKSNGKPGSLRGAGKRSSMPAPSKPDALEIVEEDGMTYDPTIAGLEPSVASKGKRKREDDGGYHPKLGAPDGKTKRSRPKKKKAEGEGGTPGSSARKSKAKAKVPEDTVMVEEPGSVPPAV